MESQVVFTFYATAIYTGMRAGELAGLHKRDINFDERLICVQRSFNKPTKTGQVRYVPILDPLLPVLKEWLIKSPGAFAFPKQNGEMLTASARIFKEVRSRILKRGGFEPVVRNGKLAEYIRFHDLRHTFASYWVASGGSLEKLRVILGHQTMDMTLRYAHLQPEAFREDYGRLKDHLRSETAKVLNFK